jgi:hypothetical protein
VAPDLQAAPGAESDAVTALVFVGVVAGAATGAAAVFGYALGKAAGKPTPPACIVGEETDDE